MAYNLVGNIAARERDRASSSFTGVPPVIANKWGGRETRKGLSGGPGLNVVMLDQAGHGGVGQGYARKFTVASLGGEERLPGVIKNSASSRDSSVGQFRWGRAVGIVWAGPAFNGGHRAVRRRRIPSECRTEKETRSTKQAVVEMFSQGTSRGTLENGDARLVRRKRADADLDEC